MRSLCLDPYSIFEQVQSNNKRTGMVRDSECLEYKNPLQKNNKNMHECTRKPALRKSLIKKLKS